MWCDSAWEHNIIFQKTPKVHIQCWKHKHCPGVVSMPTVEEPAPPWQQHWGQYTCNSWLMGMKMQKTNTMHWQNVEPTLGQWVHRVFWNVSGFLSHSHQVKRVISFSFDRHPCDEIDIWNRHFHHYWRELINNYNRGMYLCRWWCTVLLAGIEIEFIYWK